jgi:DNA-binding beta-propeller fold protein YncE
MTAEGETLAGPGWVPPRMRTSPRRSLILTAACCLMAGCGSGGVHDTAAKPLPPAAEPGVSPVPAATPAGRVQRLDAFPEGIAVDPGTGRVAVGLRNPDRLAILDGASGRLLHRLVLPESPRHLLLGREPGVVLVPAERADTLVRVNVRTARILSRVRVGTFPHGVVQSGRRIFVADELGGRISVVQGDQVLATLGGLTQPGGLAIAGGRLAVVDVRTRRLVVFDVRTLKRLADVPAGIGATHAVADRAGEILVADTEGRALLVYRLTPTVRLVGRLPLPGTPYGIAIDPVHDQLWLTLTSSNRLLGFQVGHGRPRQFASYPTVRQPNTVAVDPASGRLFVASRTASELETIRPRP